MSNNISIPQTKVFVIMPFTDVFFEVYEMLKRVFSDEFIFSNAAEVGNQQNIMGDVVQPIYEADAVLADLTGLNPNVLYELGIAHSLNKKTIVITQDDLSTLPFDLKSYRAYNYSTHFIKFDSLRKELKRNLDGAKDGSVTFSNPVKDFLDVKQIKPADLFEKTQSSNFDDSERGFLDYLAEIEENTENMNIEINSMSVEMNEMSTDIVKSTKEIERVQKSGGSGTAAFVRKEAKKVANCIDTFSRQLKLHNTNLVASWDNIESNILSLIESKFISTDDNKEGLVSFLTALNDIKTANIENEPKITDFQNSIKQSIGVERSLNKAITFLNEDLNNYLNFTSKLSVSVDKIFAKSRFIVGEINFGEKTDEHLVCS